MSTPSFPAPDPRDVDPRAVRRAFGRAASTYDAAAALQREIGARMAQRLDYVKLAPALVLDAGCGTGEAIGELGIRYPSARVVALDNALPMVAAARPRGPQGRSL
jgi:malonyl-CoA O-methyltransferase